MSLVSDMSCLSFCCSRVQNVTATVCCPRGMVSWVSCVSCLSFCCSRVPNPKSQSNNGGLQFLGICTVSCVSCLSCFCCSWMCQGNNLRLQFLGFSLVSCTSCLSSECPTPSPRKKKIRLPSLGMSGESTHMLPLYSSFFCNGGGGGGGAGGGGSTPMWAQVTFISPELLFSTTPEVDHVNLTFLGPNLRRPVSARQMQSGLTTIIVIIIIIITVSMGAFISIFPKQFKAPQGWKRWSLLPTGAT